MVKYALITGASGDIGKAISLKLASAGYSLYLHYNKNKAGIDELISILEQQNVKHFVIQSDFSSPSQPNDFITQIHHSIELIVHNSGQSKYELFTDVSVDELQSYIHTNLTVPVLITKELLPNMVQAKCGNIIFITSIWGQAGASCEVLYSTVKGGQNTFVKALAKEVALSGIRVNAIAPGAIETKMMANFSDEERLSITEEIPMGRFGLPKEVANAVSFLASDQASYITGQILSLNGGWYC